MVMTLLTRPKKTVATVVVAQDGSGDTTDIQTGVNLLPATGGVVYIREGTYTITATINIPNNSISIIGAGHSTIIQATDAITTLIEVGAGIGYFTIEDCLLDGNNNITSEVLRFSGTTTRSKVSGCWFEEWGPVGIHLIGEIDAVIVENNVFELIGGVHSTPNYAISIVDSHSCYIRGNFIRGGDLAAAVQGIRMIASVGGRALFNSIIDNKIVVVDYGIYIDGVSGASQQAIISNNYIQVIIDGTAGIKINDSEANLMSNNFLISSLIHGGIGIDITTNSHHNPISNNFLAFFTTGINIATGSDENIIDGNQFYDPTTGINIAAATCDGTIITSNEFYSAGTTISDAGTNTKIEHNYPGKTRYLSVPCSGWTTINPDVSNITIGSNFIRADADGISFRVPVNLPDGAIVTAAVVYGNATATAETWTLYRSPYNDVSSQIMAQAAIETQDTTISNATVDNQTYAYNFFTTSLDTNDEIWGARITYTL